AVAAAAGITLGPDVVGRMVQAAGALGADAYSSLHYDLTRGHRLELETLHGYAVRLGERLGVPTPTIFAVYAALLPHAAGGRA
ncbi:MAG: 2-dehydropantoate 2-reductase, partial [Candidatus Rokubacteria bacterium]|nr:2-dehydropantoate 2-reductase [Candidatus Rokubacteria bacterium]